MFKFVNFTDVVNLPSTFLNPAWKVILRQRRICKIVKNIETTSSVLSGILQTINRHTVQKFFIL